MKKALVILLGIGFILCLTVVIGFAQQYHISYSGADFHGRSSNDGYLGFLGGVWAQLQGSLVCGVNFPDSANGMQVQRVSISFKDNSDSYFYVMLCKKDRWTANESYVAILSTQGLSKSTSVRYLNIPKSQMNSYGIDNTRYSWHLHVYFEDGGGAFFNLEQVTIRYY